MMNKAETLKSGVVSSTGSVDWRSKLPHSNLNPGLFFGGCSTRQRQRKYQYPRYSLNLGIERAAGRVEEDISPSKKPGVGFICE